LSRSRRTTRTRRFIWPGLAWPGAEALGRCGGQLRVGGGGQYPDFLDHARAGAEGIADPAAEGFLSSPADTAMDRSRVMAGILATP
jgi:hypothetical protein